MHELVLMY